MSWKVLYTHQLTKKAKVWQDGTLRFPDAAGSRGLLYDDKNNRIDMLHLRPEQVEQGAELRAERHLVQIEEENLQTKDSTIRVYAPSLPVRDNAPRSGDVAPELARTAGGDPTVQSSGVVRSGLSKKRKGFVPPRPSKRAYLSNVTESPPPRWPVCSPQPSPQPVSTFPTPNDTGLETERIPLRREATALLDSGLFAAFNGKEETVEKIAANLSERSTEGTCTARDSSVPAVHGRGTSRLDSLLGPSKRHSLASALKTRHASPLIEKGVERAPSLPHSAPKTRKHNAASVANESFEISEVPFWLLDGAGDAEREEPENERIIRTTRLPLTIGDGRIDSPECDGSIESNGIEDSCRRIVGEILESALRMIVNETPALELAKIISNNTQGDGDIIPETPDNSSGHNVQTFKQRQTFRPPGTSKVPAPESPSYSPMLDLSSDISISLDSPSQFDEPNIYTTDDNSVIKDILELNNEDIDELEYTSPVESLDRKIDRGDSKMDGDGDSKSVPIPESEKNVQTLSLTVETDVRETPNRLDENESEVTLETVTETPGKGISDGVPARKAGSPIVRSEYPSFELSFSSLWDEDGLTDYDSYAEPPRKAEVAEPVEDTVVESNSCLDDEESSVRLSERGEVEILDSGRTEDETEEPVALRNSKTGNGTPREVTTAFGRESPLIVASGENGVMEFDRANTFVVGESAKNAFVATESDSVLDVNRVRISRDGLNKLVLRTSERSGDTRIADTDGTDSGSSESTVVRKGGERERYPYVERVLGSLAPAEESWRKEKADASGRLKSACDPNWAEGYKMSGTQCGGVARRRPEGLLRKLGMAGPSYDSVVPRNEYPRPASTPGRATNEAEDYSPTPTFEYGRRRSEPIAFERSDDVTGGLPISGEECDADSYRLIERFENVECNGPIRGRDKSYSSRYVSEPLANDEGLYEPFEIENFDEAIEMEDIRQRISEDFAKCEDFRIDDVRTRGPITTRRIDDVRTDGPMRTRRRIDDVTSDTRTRTGVYRSAPFPVRNPSRYGSEPISDQHLDDDIPDEPIRESEQVLDLEAYLGPDYEAELATQHRNDSQQFLPHQKTYQLKETPHEQIIDTHSNEARNNDNSRWTKFVEQDVVETPTPLPYRSRFKTPTSGAPGAPPTPSQTRARFGSAFKAPASTMRAAAATTPGVRGQRSDSDNDNNNNYNSHQTSTTTGRSSVISSSAVTKALSGDLHFPAESELEANELKRQIVIPVSFPDVQSYKRTLVGAIKEYLNISLHQLAKVYHAGHRKVDLEEYIKAVNSFIVVNSLLSGGSRHGHRQQAEQSNVPCCEHGTPAKMVQVRKDGPNKGRFFYSCNSPRAQQCKFFKWADLLEDGRAGGSGTTVRKVALLDHQAISSYFTKLGVPFYCECSFLRKTSDARIDDLLSSNKYRRTSSRTENTKKRIYIRLSRREKSDTYAKNDLWIISLSLHFDRGETFLARSVFFGPNTANEVEIEPMAGYSPSNWTNKVMCHAILACNAGSELTNIANIHDHVQARSPPLVRHLVDRMGGATRRGVAARGFQTPSLIGPAGSAWLDSDLVLTKAEQFIREHHLNEDQALALKKIGSMLVEHSDDAVCLVHGVFGAGKSYLLAVVVLYLLELFTVLNERAPSDGKWKLLVSSTTNVAVDRILQWLLELGFTDFVRVGSVKKIAKPVLPYSVHAFGSESQELKELKDLDKSELSAQERSFIRRSIEHHKLGLNRRRLGSSLVVGATCAACPFPCMDKMKFPVVLLDECSQITEPSSLLPVARFMAERLVLVGDPQQLGPTLQGSGSEHNNGLEQTLFDRLLKMEHESVLLRTQYRCHPRISRLANELFYRGQLQDGVVGSERPALMPGLAPTVFLDVSRGREGCGFDGSYYNEAEVAVCVRLIGVLLSASGLEPQSIGVITLYRNQAAKLSAALRESGLCRSQRDVRAIQVSTVDAFQGAERDVIILSCVRTDHVGFIDSDKRTNVALTRARNHLVIVGNQRNLNRNPLWGRIVQHCKETPDGVHNAESFLGRFTDVSPTSTS